MYDDAPADPSEVSPRSGKPRTNTSPICAKPTMNSSPMQSLETLPHPLYSFAKDKIRALILENVNETAIKIFQTETYSLEIEPRALSEEELVERIKGIHLLCIRSKTRITDAVFRAADRLLAVGCFCIGTDQVDLTAAEKYGVPVFNAPFSNTRSVAELVLAEIICLARRIPDKSSAAHAGIWDKSAKGCFEVRGKTLGIIGYGHIGSQLSILAEAMGMRVVYYDVVSVLPIGNGKAMASMDDLLKCADVVSLHVPNIESTKNLISAPQLALMKPSAFLINAARGHVVNLEDLADAIKSGHIGGAGVDVYPFEPAKNGPGFESPLRGLPNVILTPHIGGSTSEAQRNIGVEVATALIKYVNQGCSIGAVNFPNQDIPESGHCHRILNVHQNVPGVLSAINGILSGNKCNVKSQVLGTSTSVGYLIIDVDKETSHETKDAISSLETSISTRILY